MSSDTIEIVRLSFAHMDKLQDRGRRDAQEGTMRANELYTDLLQKFSCLGVKLAKVFTESFVASYMRGYEEAAHE